MTSAATVVDLTQMTRAQRSVLPLSTEVAQAIAEQHGVCIRPLAMRRIDTTTGQVEVVAVPCRSTREDQCRPCADKARRLRMAQCRQGWHLDEEPVIQRATPSEEHKELMATRADLVAIYAECRSTGDEASCEQIADSVAELDTEIRAAGIRGRLTPLDPPPKPVKRSTRRRQDAPNLPRRPVEKRTVGQVFAGRYRPSTFLTLTLDSYGRVDTQGAAIDPGTYDYQRAARDAIHFPALVDRFWQNTRRCLGWDVQYFSTVEPQKRGAPHLHAAIRGAISRAELRAITAATYHQVWWPHHDHPIYGGDHVPVWDPHAKAFTDPDTHAPLPTFDQACTQLTEPAHVVRFGDQVHVKGILGGTEEAGRHIGYLTKYLTKSIGHTIGLTEHATPAQREHARRLHAQLQITPCSPRCAVWLLYGIQPVSARYAMSPGHCKAKRISRSTSASPGAASSYHRSGRTRPLMTTTLNAPLLFGNSSKLLASNPATAPKTVHTSGNAPLPPIPTFHPDLSCSCAPSLNNNGGEPNTSPPNSLLTAKHHHPTTVRQLPIKRRERNKP